MPLLENDTVQTERRTTPRNQIRSLIYLSLEANNGGILLDLTPNGMKVSVACPLHTGTNVHFSFGSVASQRIEGVGHIAWIARSGKRAGICFQDLSAESSAKIEDLLKSASLNPVAGHFPPKHESEQPPNAHAGLPGPADTPRPETRSPLSDSLSAVSRSASHAAAASTRLNGAALMAEATGQFTLAHGNSPLDIPAAADIDKPPDFASSPLELHHSSPGHETHNSATTTVPGQADNKPRIPSNSNLGDTPPEFVVPQSDLPLNQVTEQSNSPVVNTRASRRRSGINDPLQPFTLTPTYDCPPSAWALIGKEIVSAFIAIGGELESDWHAIAGLLLLAAGFLALAQHPPLIVLAVALWIAAASVLTGTKSATQKTDP